MSQLELFPDFPDGYPSQKSFPSWYRYDATTLGYQEFHILPLVPSFDPVIFRGFVYYVKKSELKIEGNNCYITLNGTLYNFSKLIAQSLYGEYLVLFTNSMNIVAVGSTTIEGLTNSVRFNVYRISRGINGRSQVNLVGNSFDLHHSKELAGLLNRSNQCDRVLYVTANMASGLIIGNIIYDLIEIAPPPSASHIPYIRKISDGDFGITFHDPSYESLDNCVDPDSLQNQNLQFAY